MKITRIDNNGTTTHEFQNIEEFRQYMKFRAEMGDPVQLDDLGFSMRTAMTTPVLPVAPEIVGDEIAEDEDDQDTTIVHKKVIRRRTRVMTPNPPSPDGLRWPETFHITPEGLETLMLLRQYPEGLTGEEITVGLEGLPGKGSGRVNRLRRYSPLVELVDDGLYRLTRIGADESLRFEVSKNPSPKNKKLGWDRFMAIPLPDGKRKKTRR